MASESKCQKSIEEEEEDRISNLPSSLIGHILSLLPTKYAVRTSTLSTFWNPQWTSITQLRFDDASAPETSSTPETKACFVNFVYRVLLHLQVASPDVFQLNCSQDYGANHVNSWVSAALSRHIQNIDISVPTDEPGLLPRSLFSCRNLVTLKLGTRFLLKVPVFISLDSLKILHLTVKFSDNGSLSRLVSSCPVLEELELRGIIDDNVNEVEISSIALKRLILIGFNPCSEPRSNSYRVVLNTPCLQYFDHLDSHVAHSYSLGILRCLNRARIDVKLRFNRLPLIDALRLTLLTMASLCLAISSTIKFLYLSKVACQALNLVQSNLPKFPRLIELELAETCWTTLKGFLERSPELATLSFQYSFLGPDQNYYEGRALYPPGTVPLCLLSNLERVEIRDFSGQQIELGIVSFFLEKSKCLNKLLISYSSRITKEGEAEISKKLLMLPRASTSCIVVIT